jgi:hypothetical protein
MAAPPLLAPSDFPQPVLHGVRSSSGPTGGNLPWYATPPPHVPPLAPPRASSTLCPHASLNRSLEPLPHPWKVKFHREGAGEWGHRVSDSPPDIMPKSHIQLPLFRPRSSQVCAGQARRQFLERRGGATGDFNFDGGAALDGRPAHRASPGDFFKWVRPPDAPPSPVVSPAPPPQACVGLLEGLFQRLASAPCACPRALLLAEAAHHHARCARHATRRQRHAQSDRAGSSACIPRSRVPARRVLLSLAGSHVRSPPPLAGLTDGATLIGHHRRGRQPAAVGRGSSMTARSTIGGGHACCSRRRAAARERRENRAEARGEARAATHSFVRCVYHRYRCR